VQVRIDEGLGDELAARIDLGRGRAVDVLCDRRDAAIGKRDVECLAGLMAQLGVLD
jgi:hypothetical protein